MRGGGSHCHPDTAAAATHPMGASVSFSECSFLIMIKNLVTVSNQPQHAVQSTVIVNNNKNTGLKFCGKVVTRFTNGFSSSLVQMQKSNNLVSQSSPA